MLITDADTGRVELFSQALPAALADQCLAELLSELKWEQHQVRLFGRVLDCPRLSAWHADAGLSYRYSGVRHRPSPWTPALLRIRDGLAGITSARFNGVLANLYRNGKDHVGWHADDEPELGPLPGIASVSLGATRRFHLRLRGKSNCGKSVDLQHGDVLIMSGNTQRFWQHQLAATARRVELRINLSFRKISYASA